MNAAYVFLEPHAMVVSRYAGPVEIDAVLRQEDEIGAQPWIDRVACAVADFREATSIDRQKGIRRLLQVHARGDNLYRMLPAALIFDRPMETALGILYEKGVRQDREVRVVSTPEAAATWLRRPVEAIETALSELRSTPR